MSLAAFIDHTLLKPESTSAQIRRLCEEAREHRFFGVCVNSSWVPEAVALLRGSTVQVVGVVGFPLGAMSTEAKAFETRWCVEQGASEVDMVLPIGRLLEGAVSFVENDIRAVVQAAGGRKVKVILETALLNNDQIRLGCQLSAKAGAQFVKTCTGFNGGAATVEHIRLMRETVGPNIGVKASGGIKTPEQAKALLDAGANRLGTSSGVALVTGAPAAGGY